MTTSKTATKICPICTRKYSRGEMNLSIVQWAVRKFCSNKCAKINRTILVASRPSRLCRLCKRTLPSVNFPFRCSGTGARKSWCIDCDRVYHRARRVVRTRKCPKGKYRTPPLKFKGVARSKLQRAVRSGLIIRQSCEVCGATPTQAHHENYEKPYEVRWLCQACHSKEHRLPTSTPLTESSMVQHLSAVERSRP